SPIQVGNNNRLPLLAPGAVQTFYVKGDLNPYLVVANSLSNDILLYHYQPASEQFALVSRYSVGDDPVSITVKDITGDGIPDLAVANRGSNDVSILVGARDASTHSWRALPYQRLSADGSGPVGVSFLPDPGKGHGPDLVVTNSDGTVILLPGIGKGGEGSGFFDELSASRLHVPGVPLGPLDDNML